MQISSINSYNQTFQARIKIQKPKNLKSLIAGGSMVAAGVTSTVLGIDNNAELLNSNGLGLADSILDSCKNEHIEFDGNVKDFVANNDSALSAYASMDGSLVSSPFLLGSGAKKLFNK